MKQNITSQAKNGRRMNLKKILVESRETTRARAAADLPKMVDGVCPHQGPEDHKREREREMALDWWNVNEEHEILVKATFQAYLAFLSSLVVVFLFVVVVCVSLDFK